MLRDLLLALSLSNLCFITAWRSLLVPSSFFYYYHQKSPPPPMEYLALILDVVLLATVFFIGIVFTRRSQNKWIKKCSRALFILILSVPLYGVLTQIDHPAVKQFMLHVVSDQVAKRLLASIPLTICIFVVLLMILRMQRGIKLAVSAILILTPFMPLTFSQAGLTAMKYRHAGNDQIPPPKLSQSERRPRVLWLIFDELDFRAAFVKRSESLDLPELDRLAGESLVAANAYPPAGETFLTMPSLITGRLISDAERRSPDELLIRFGEDVAPVSWRSQPSVFSRAREAGFNTALFGWYHPYCRILGSHLTKCSWEGQLVTGDTATGNVDGFPAPSFARLGTRMVSHARRAARAIPLWNFIFNQRVDAGPAVRTRQLSIFDTTYRQALEAASDWDMGLVMIHWPIPHPPNIYDRTTSKISVADGHSYLDNLALVDRTLGSIRQVMEEKGAWDSTIVLVTSDHWWRTDYWKKLRAWTSEDEASSEATLDRRIPFILKMATAKEHGIRYESQFNTVLTHDLLLSVLRGEVSDMNGAAAWLDRNRSIGRSPYDDRTSR
jgi:hypothetical protein